MARAKAEGSELASAHQTPYHWAMPPHRGAAIFLMLGVGWNVLPMETRHPRNRGHEEQDPLAPVSGAAGSPGLAQVSRARQKEQ